ncbi:hypothetical protein HPB48_003215 [Haemaphysalis longicornis]|uniref:Methyltransferase-like protein 22 n=1 Tax=Haemaphysalis longicornis TaxID=44386 RepID=A0A9J6FT28_HAELO|nr:hypothetical protein HPB48_003215 [Haemaphysalis longicornis]
MAMTPPEDSVCCVVGLQLPHIWSGTVWKAALVMSDFLLHRGRELLRGKGVVEFGSGAGLCGVVAAAFADYVICTDAWEEVLHLCGRNLKQNEAFYEALDVKPAPAKVRCLDWTKGLPETQTATGSFGWSASERDEFLKAEVFLAADVVYDDGLTDCLFELLLKGVTRAEQVVFIALEKRVNFTLDDLDVVSPSHAHFTRWLERLHERGWQVGTLDLSSIPQHFCGYSRDSYLAPGVRLLKSYIQHGEAEVVIKALLAVSRIIYYIFVGCSSDCSDAA